MAKIATEEATHLASGEPLFGAVANKRAPGLDRDAGHEERLSPRQEAFCKFFVECNNAAQAYRQTYDVSDVQGAWIWVEAARLRALPKIARRVQELQERASEELIITARQILQDWADIATADPNLIVSVSIRACRHCYGTQHQYQWTHTEWMLACSKALQAEKEMPDCSGGFDFNPHQPPALDCPMCFGDGEHHTQLHDTTRLDPKTRKLYKGVKQTKDGIQVLLHDQHAARDSIARMLGAYNDRLLVIPKRPTGARAEKPQAYTPEEAQRAYMDMVRAGGGG